MKKIKVAISIDGGGIRGVMSLAILDYINELLKKQDSSAIINNYLDFVAGTSTGAIISSSLVVKKHSHYLFTINDLLHLYIERGPQLFNLSTPKGAKSEGLKLLLKRQLKAIFLADLETDFAFVSYDKSVNQPFVFTKEFPKEKEFPLSMALAACSAIPGYFEPVIYRNHQLVDGIITAKNPAKIAYEKMRELFPKEEILLISIGTGQLKDEFYDEVEKEVEKVHQEVKQITEQDKNLKYYRLQPEIITAEQRMDDASKENIASLLRDTTRYIEKK